MDTLFSMGVVTPLIQFCRVILSRIVRPYCSQSSNDLSRSFTRRVPWGVLTSLGVIDALCFPYQCSAVNKTRSTPSFQDSCPSLWRGCINTRCVQIFLQTPSLSRQVDCLSVCLIQLYKILGKKWSQSLSPILPQGLVVIVFYLHIYFFLHFYGIRLLCMINDLTKKVTTLSAIINWPDYY